MKKKFFSFIVSTAILIGGAGMAACGPAEHEHVWNEGEVTVQPSCKNEGVKTFKCTVSGCNETKTEPVQKTPHSWDEGEITETPSCTKNGVKTFTCSACGGTKTESVGKTAHAYDKGTLTTVPTLTEKGEITFICGECNDVKKESVAPRDDFAEHFYTSIAQATVWQYGYAEAYNGETGEFTFCRIMQTDEEKPAVWKADGVAIERDKIYSANKAVIAYPVDGDMQLNVTVSFTGDEEETRVGAYLSVADANGGLKDEPTLISGDGKDWNYSSEEEINVTAGDTLYLLFNNCGSGAPGGKFGYRITSECKHVWDEGEETTPASCTSTGVKTFSCSKCGETKTEEIPMTDHDFTGDFVENGNGHSRKCAECGTVDTDNVSPHNLNEDVNRREPATCHSDGIKIMVCGDCGAETQQAITERPEHAMSGWEEATGGHNKHCTNDGCDYVSTTEPHNMKDGEVIKQPTATEKGQKESVCEDCGYTTIIDIPTTNHTASSEYGKDDDYHWNICGAHTDPACGEQVNKEAHDYKTEIEHIDATCKTDGKSVLACKCGATKEVVIPKDTVPHTMDAGTVTTQPTFWADGVKTFTCSVCGHTETEAVSANTSVSYKEGFNTELNEGKQVGDWCYGTVSYEGWGGDENFTFTPVTTTSEDKTAWKAGDWEVKDGFINAVGNWAVVGFTFKEAVTVEIDFTFTGTIPLDEEGNRKTDENGNEIPQSKFNCRIGIKNADGAKQPIKNDSGNMQNNPFFVGGEVCKYKQTMTFNAGDTIYFMMEHAQTGWASGNLQLNISKVA